MNREDEIANLVAELGISHDRLQARIAELEARNGYLERRHIEMENGWNACRSLADSRQSALEAMAETAAEQSRVHVEMHGDLVVQDELILKTGGEAKRYRDALSKVWDALTAEDKRGAFTDTIWMQDETNTTVFEFIDHTLNPE